MMTVILIFFFDVRRMIFHLNRWEVSNYKIGVMKIKLGVKNRM